MSIVLVVIVVGVLAVIAIEASTSRRKQRTWRERGEPRGRTRAEPEGTLHIKVTRADGTVEDHGTVPAYRSK